MSFFLIYIDERGPYTLCDTGIGLRLVLETIFNDELNENVKVISKTGRLIEWSTDIKFIRDTTLTVYSNNKPIILRIV
jgi:hypothetical protein